MNQIPLSLASVNWSELITTVASVFTAGIAFSALKSWQRQDRAKREAEFLDGLIEATHAFIVAVPKPIALLRSAKIGMSSHVKNWEAGSEEDKAVRGAIAYIAKRGEKDGELLNIALEAVGPAVIKLRSLASKGQIFKFRNYTDCQNAVAMLTWQFDRIISFKLIIDSPTWNWENPEVLKLLKGAMKIEPDEMQQSIGQFDVAVLKFVRDTYERIYS